MVNNIEMSERERDILKHVATGMSNKEIAQALQISTNTVKVHLRNIFAKIGVMSRTEATLYAIEHRIVDSPGNNGNAVMTGNAGKNTFLQKNRRAILLLVIFVILGAVPLTWYLTSIRSSFQTPGNSSTQYTNWKTHASLPEGRAGMAAVAYENQIYVFSGETENGITGTSLRFDSLEDEWLQIDNKPSAVIGAQAVTIGEKIYIPGGWTGKEVVATNEVYEPRTNSWEVRSSLPEPRSNYAMTTLEGKIYLFGGWDGTTFTNTIFSYDPADDVWVELSPMPDARVDMGAIALGSKIYVIGGRNNNGLIPRVDLYIPARDKPGDSPWNSFNQMPFPVCYTSIATGFEKIYLLGVQSDKCNWSGYSDLFVGEFVPLMYLFDQQSLEWYNIEVTSLDLGFGSKIVALNNYIYVFGGKSSEVFLSQIKSYQVIYTTNLPILISP